MVRSWCPSVDAAAALASKAVGHQLDPVDAKRLLRKIDRNILPLMMVLYAMQFVDKTTLGNSSILGIKTDTHLSTTQYNLLGFVVTCIRAPACNHLITFCADPSSISRISRSSIRRTGHCSASQSENGWSVALVSYSS